MGKKKERRLFSSKEWGQVRKSFRKPPLKKEVGD